VALSTLDRILKKAREKSYLHEATVEKHYGVTYFYRIKNYELAFEHFLRMYEMVKNVSKRDFSDKTNCLKELAYAYYYFDDYPKTIELTKATVRSELEVGESAHLCRNYNLIGVCFRKLKQTDSSDYYFRQSFQTAIKRRDTLWMGINYGELGYNAFTKQQFEQAKPLLSKALAIVKPRNEVNSTAKALTTLGAMALITNQDAEAKALLLEAKKYANVLNELSLYDFLYPWLLKLYAKLNRPQLAMMYSDSAAWVKDSLQRQYSVRKLLRAVQANQLRQHRAEMSNIETQRKLKEWERNGMLALLVMGFGLALYAYDSQRKKFLTKQLLTQQQLHSQEEELLRATEQLQLFTRRISEKNLLIEDLQQRIGSNVPSDALQQLQQSILLTDEQWENFRLLFEQVHQGFLGRLRTKLPQLTPAEIRFLALAKLQFSNKEMAAMLGVSSQNIRTIWYRLRKKNNLPDDYPLSELIESI
jgi:DNA-binding CsgD family transcriptional regulator